VSGNDHPHESRSKTSNGSGGGLSGYKMVEKVKPNADGNRAERRAAARQNKNGK
jgi:hypothetical protein